MSEIPLNKFEKRDLILRLGEEGKTYREICHMAHVSPRDIKPILKEYKRKKKLGNSKRKENSQLTTKKLSKCSQAYGLFLDGKTPVRVAMDLNFRFPTS